MNKVTAHTNNGHNRIRGKYLAVAAAACMISASTASYSTFFAFFLVPVSESLNIDRTAFSMVYSILAMVALFFSIIWGQFLEKIGIRKVIIICSLSITACFIGLSYGTNVTTFYIIAVLLGIASSGGTILVAATLVSNWFVEKRGQVMALVMACSNIGGILGGFFLPSFIDSFGWNMGFVFSAVYFFVLTIPAGMFLVKNSPRNVGLQAFGTNTLKEESHSGKAIFENTHNIDFKQGVKSPLFYLLFIGTALISFPTSFVQHMSAFATDTGVSPKAAGITVVVRSVVAIFATIIFGRANDRIGTVKSTTIFLALFILSFVGFILVRGFVPILITTIVFSAGTGCGSTMPAIIVGTLFGTKDFGKYFSLLTSAMALGVIIGTPLMGKIYDQTSSYNLAFIISIACIVLGLLCLLFCLKKSKYILG